MPDIYLRPGAANPNDIILRDPTTGDSAYDGILKRWTGATWVKEPLKVYLAGSFQVKPLKMWSGSTWVNIDTTGV